jgi:type II secretory pathway pseudopilin PulG
MMKRQAKFHPHAGRGYAMLGMIVTLGAAATVAVTSLSATTLRNQQAQKTTTVLAQAKQALIGRAASDANHPGSLPCPDAVTNIAGSNVPNDGVADLLAGQVCPSMIGRLPWRTLGLPDLRDADGERLWYLVAPAYQDSPSKIINPGTSGQLSAYDCSDQSDTPQAWPCDNPRAVAATPWVAIVFSPGKVLGVQTRDAAHAGDYAQYLESYNPADPYRVRVAAGAGHNDRITTISTDDIFAVVQRRVANELQVALAKYYATTAAQGRPQLPLPAATCTSSIICSATSLPVPLPAVVRGHLPSDDIQLNQIMAAQNMSWFDHNQWRATFTYLVDANCAGAAMAAHCGTAFATLDGSLWATGTTVIGGNASALTAGTRAALVFAGVAAGANSAQKTRLAIALQ